MKAITYIGHSTTLIESNGSAVLTDPVLGKRVLLLKRQEELGYDPGKLPELAAILISHAHYDHLNFSSFKYIKGNVPVFVPEGLGRFVGRLVRNPVIELHHYGTHKLPNGTEIGSLYAQHAGFRLSGLRFRECNSYVINFPNNGGTIYFAGDTGYGSHFKEIARNHPNIDVALLPIGGYAPKWFMQRRHMNPVESVQAFLDLKAKNFIPIHHSAFKLSAEKLNAPIEWLSRVAVERELANQVQILKSGEKFEF